MKKKKRSEDYKIIEFKISYISKSDIGDKQTRARDVQNFFLMNALSLLIFGV